MEYPAPQCTGVKWSYRARDGPSHELHNMFCAQISSSRYDLLKSSAHFTARKYHCSASPPHLEVRTAPGDIISTARYSGLFFRWEHRLSWKFSLEFLEGDIWGWLWETFFSVRRPLVHKQNKLSVLGKILISWENIYPGLYPPSCEFNPQNWQGRGYKIS